MSPARNLLVMLLAVAGALSWGPPTMLAICLADRAPSVAGNSESCCRPVPSSGTAVDECDHSSCRGCCAKLLVGLGLDGAGTRVEPAAVPAPSASLVLTAPAFVAPAPPVARPVPRPPPEKVLPLRI